MPIMYLNKEVVKWIKRTFPTREVKFHDIDFIAIDYGCHWTGVIIKEIEDIKEEK